MDWFEWNPMDNRESLIAKYARYFCFRDVGEIFRSFRRTLYWGEGTDYIAGAHTSEGNIVGVIISIWIDIMDIDDEECDVYHRSTLSKQESLDFFRQLRDQYVAEHPLEKALIMQSWKEIKSLLESRWQT